MTTGLTKRTKIIIKKIVFYVLLVFGSIIFIIPFVWMFRSSFMEMGQIFIMPVEWIPNPFQWQNYPQALTSFPFFLYLRNTSIIIFFVEFGTILTSTMSAFAFSHLRWPGRDIVFYILLTSLMVPYVVTLIPTFLMWKYIGGINTFLPLTVPSWFGGGMFNVFLLRQFFLSIPRELDEAAYIDGANPLQVLWKIIVPLSTPALITVAIFTFLFTWNDLLGPVVYLNNPRMYTLAVGLSSFVGSYSGQWNKLMAASTLVTLVPIILFFIGQKFFIKGIALTGLKE